MNYLLLQYDTDDRIKYYYFSSTCRLLNIWSRFRRIYYLFIYLFNPILLVHNIKFDTFAAHPEVFIHPRSYPKDAKTYTENAHFWLFLYRLGQYKLKKV